MNGKQQEGHGVAADDYADSLAPGYRFCPTDPELIVYYLKPKIEKQIHPGFARFYDVNIYDYHPKELAEKYTACEDKWYFMTPREPRYANGKRPNRQTKDDGTWKASTYTQVENSNGQVVGLKRSLAYFEHHVKKTEWLMHEYTTATDDNKMSECVVLCKIYKKESSETKKNIKAIQDKNKRKNQQEKNQDEPSPIRRRISGNQENNNNQPQQQQVQFDTTTATSTLTTTGSHHQVNLPAAQSLTGGDESGFGHNQVEDDGDEFDEILTLLYQDDDAEDENIDKNSKQSLEVPDEDNYDEDEIDKLMKMFDDEIDYKNSKRFVEEPQVDNEGDEFGEKMTLFHADDEERNDKLMAELDQEDDVGEEIHKKSMEVADHDVANGLDKAMARSDDKDVSRISFSRSDCVRVFSFDDLFSC